MPRIPRVTFKGSIHHVFGRAIEKRQIFFVDSDYVKFLSKLTQLTQELDTSISCWCLMPNHFHMLLRVGEVPLATFMARLLTSYAVYYNRRYQRVGRLFQNRYGSRLVQDDPYFLHVSRYILLNPVHSGLVSDPARYPYSSMAELLGDKRWQILDKGEVVRLIGEETDAFVEYRRFVFDGIRKDLSEWDPFASDREFIGSPQFATQRGRKHVRQRKSSRTIKRWPF